MLLNCAVGGASWESLGLQGDPTCPSWRRSVLGVFMRRTDVETQLKLKYWNSNTLGTWCKKLTHLIRPWCWERLRAGGEGDARGWDGWMALPIQWTWVSVNSGSWWWTGRPGMLQFMGFQRVGHAWATELNWTEQLLKFFFQIFIIMESLKFSVFFTLWLCEIWRNSRYFRAELWVFIGHIEDMVKGKLNMHGQLLSSVWFLYFHGLCQAPLSIKFSRQDYWKGLHFLLQGLFQTQALNPGLLCLLHCRWILY